MLFPLWLFYICHSLRYAGRARDIKNVPHRVLEEGAAAAAGSGRGANGSGGNGTSLRGTVDEIELLRTKLVETTAVRTRAHRDFKAWRRKTTVSTTSR